MNIKIHRSEQRGKADHGWLNTRFSFSFADYFNPDRMGFGTLRVLNDDIIEPSKGFDFHPHDNMEIVSIVLDGVLEHKDNIGNHGEIPFGDVQRMSAGTGVVHSEFNASKKNPVQLLQIWIQTKEQNIEPSYEQKSFAKTNKKNKLVRIVSGSKKEGALYLHQKAEFSLGEIEKGKTVNYNSEAPESGIFVFLIEGKISIGKEELAKRDSAEIKDEKEIEIVAKENSVVLVIEVTMN